MRYYLAMYWRLKQKMHASWQIAWFALGILLGTAAILLLPASFFMSPVWLLTGACLFIAIFYKSYTAFAALALIAGLLVGLWRGSLGLADLASFRPHFKKVVELRGEVVEDATVSTGGEQELTISVQSMGGRQLNGQVWASVAKTDEIKRGDTVLIKGKLSEGFGSFAATMFRAELQTVYRPHPGDIARQVRDYFANSVRKEVAEPEASLGIGFLTGQKSTLPQDLQEQLQVVGLTHIVVASGYNLTILVTLARRLFIKISKYLSAVFAGLMVLGFIFVTGFSPSMQRAGLVAGLTLFAWYYGRVIHPIVLLLFSAALTLLMNPAFLWGDIGWYLSFLAFIGVLMLSPLFQRYFWGERKLGVLLSILVDTISAQLLTLPLLLLVFGQYSLYALPANLLIVPLIPFAMLLTFIAGVSNLLMPDLALIISLPTQALLQVIVIIVQWIAIWPGAQNEFQLPIWGCVVFYTLILLLLLFLRYKTSYSWKKVI